MKRRAKMFLIGLVLGVVFGSLVTLGAPYHRHDWTKWENHTVVMRNFVSRFGNVKDMGTSIATEEYRHCQKCGKRQERYVD